MTNPAQELQDLLNNLTPVERQQLATSTVADWIEAVRELFADPTFWHGLGVAALNGIADGLEDFNADN